MTHFNLKIGIDFHGVITASPKFFKDFTRLAQEQGFKIYIISGGPYQKVKDYLDAHEIKYDSIFALVDYFAAQGKVTYGENGRFEVEEDLWNRAKAEYCREHGINIQIDDSPEYGVAFSTPFCHYNSEKKVCEVDGHQIDFGVSPEQTLNLIGAYLKQNV